MYARDYTSKWRKRQDASRIAEFTASGVFKDSFGVFLQNPLFYLSVSLIGYCLSRLNMTSVILVIELVIFSRFMARSDTTEYWRDFFGKTWREILNKNWPELFEKAWHDFWNKNWDDFLNTTFSEHKALAERVLASIILMLFMGAINSFATEFVPLLYQNGIKVTIPNFGRPFLNPLFDVIEPVHLAFEILRICIWSFFFIFILALTCDDDNFQIKEIVRYAEKIMEENFFPYALTMFMIRISVGLAAYGNQNFHFARGLAWLVFFTVFRCFVSISCVTTYRKLKMIYSKTNG